MGKIIFRIILILSIAYNFFLWRKLDSIESLNKYVEKNVTFINCNATKSSWVKIIYNGSEKRVEIPREKCKKIQIGDKLKLIHLKSEYFANGFYFPGNKSNASLFVFFCIIFVLSFINFEKLKNKIDGKSNN